MATAREMWARNLTKRRLILQSPDLVSPSQDLTHYFLPRVPLVLLVPLALLVLVAPL